MPTGVPHVDDERRAALRPVARQGHVKFRLAYQP
jgi:hypothetical protein